MKLIVGNWKMYPRTLKEAKHIFVELKKGAKKTSRVRVVICPPHLYTASLMALSGTSKIAVGGQDAFYEDEGARTGETSPSALFALGASHVILGHSERRAMGEGDDEVAKKAQSAVRNKLSVILCVGERSRDEAGAYFSEVSAQLRASLSGFPKKETGRLIIAYEPIWAIGTKAKRAALPADFCEMSILIRRHLVEFFGKKLAFAIPILYGGSVDDHNAEGFLREGGADGLLIGRVSLDAEKLSSIIHIADHIR